MNAVIYARYSSHNQREESIEGQLRECHDFAKKNDITVVGEYCDYALSGKTDQRPEFQRLIKDSERHQFDAVIMYTLDRFARNRYDSAIYKAKLKKNGVKIYYAKQPMPDTPEGIILESVLEGYAEYYSENLARSIKRGMRENALHCMATGQVVPLGYKIENKKYVIDPVGAKAVRYIFEQYAKGMSKSQIVRECNVRGYKTSRGTAFTFNSLDHLLRNDRYKGVYRYTDVVIEGGMPVIIDADLFDRVQEKLKIKRNTKATAKAKEEYILTTKLFCGHCGKPMTGESGRSKTGRVYRYYKCSCRKKGGKCDKKPEKKDELERLVVEYTVHTVLTDENIELIAEKVYQLLVEESQDKTYLDGLKMKLKDVEKRAKNIMTAIESGIFNSMTAQRLSELEQEKESLTVSIAKEEIKRPTLTKEHIIYWLSKFKDGDINDIDYQRSIIDTLVNSIYVYDNPDGTTKYVITYNTSGSNTRTVNSSNFKGVAPLLIENSNFFVYSNWFGVVINR